MIRPSVYEDLSEITRLAKEAHSRSIYCELPLDETQLRQILLFACASGFSWLSEIEGKVVGVLLGCIDSVGIAIQGLQASDIFFFIESGPDGPALAKKFIKWGWSHKEVVIVGLSNSSGIDIDRTGKFYESLGLERAGNIYLTTRHL